MQQYEELEAGVMHAQTEVHQTTPSLGLVLQDMDVHFGHVPTGGRSASEPGK